MGSLCIGLFPSNTCGYPYPRIDEIHHRTIHTLSILSDTPTIFVKKHDQQPSTIDYNKLKPYFGWVNADTIKKTFENSPQWAVTATRFTMRKHLKSRFPAINIPFRNQVVATDTIFSDTAAIDSGVTIAQMLLVKTLWYLMFTPCIPPNNLSTLWRIR